MRDEFVFLNNLRESGITNMFGATPYLQEEFGFGKLEAREILTEWMDWVSENPENGDVGVEDAIVDDFIGGYDDDEEY